VSYGTIKFFEKIIGSHKAVASFTREHGILFRVVRMGLPQVNVLLVERYVIGVADVIRAKTEFPDLTCIVTNGTWCGYTKEAKEYGKQQGIGVFIVSELSGVLFSKRHPNDYVAKDSKGEPMYAYRDS
jgi:hypothetical protein